MKAKRIFILFFACFVFMNFPTSAFSENGNNFVFIRYSRAVRSVYVQRELWKNLILPLWFLDDPNNNYTEGSFGLGYKLLNTENLKLDVAVNTLFAGIGSRGYTTYLQPVLTPGFSYGKVSGLGVFLFDVPLRREDPFNFILDALDISYSVHSKVSIGASLFVLYNRNFQVWRAGPKITFDLNSFLKRSFIEGVFWQGSNNQDEFQIRLGFNF